MGIPERLLHIIQPFDIRGKAWDIASDVTDEAAALELASTLAPDEGRNEHPFFNSATRDILRGVLSTLNEVAPFQWSLNDVLEITSAPTTLESFLRRSQAGSKVAALYFDSQAKTTASNILSTIRTRLAPFEAVARAWARASSKLSLRAWMRSRTGLLLVGDKTVRTAVDAIHRAIFRRLSQLITSQPEAPKDETWVVLDEARELGRLEGLSDVLNEGRSKGARVVLGFQDLDGLFQVYGEHLASEMVGNCGNIAVLKLNNPRTEKWASEYFGSFKYLKASWSRSSGQHPSSSISVQEDSDAAILPQEIHNFTPTSREKGLMGVFQVPETPPWVTTVPPAFLRKHLFSPGKVPAFAPRPKSHQEHAPSRFLAGNARTSPPSWEPEPWLPDLGNE